MAYLNKNDTYTTKRVVCPSTGKGMTKTFATMDMAREWEHRAAEAVAAGKPLAAISTSVVDDRSLRAVCDRLLVEYYAFKTEATYATARGAMNRLCVLLGESTLISDVLQTGKISRFILEHKEKGYSTSYLNAFLQYFRKMSVMCVRWGILPVEVDIPPQFKRERTRFVWLSMEEVEQLLQHMPKRYHALVRFMNSTGLRVRTEALKVTPDDIQDGRVRVVGKGVKLRYVPLSATALDAIASVPDQQKGQPIFKIRYQALTYALQVASVRLGKKITPHTLRHSFASRLAQKGIDIVKLQELMGHSDITQTRRYMHLHPDWMTSVHNLLD